MKKTDDGLGRLVPVELRKHWEDEAQDFTPWLAENENISLLGEAIGLLDLQVVGKEMPVGSFKVDILAQDTSSDSDRYVVIENQLEKTNHKHLGQLLTYASGYNAGVIVWIAEKIDEEHRKTLDWLNEKTSGELYINSPAARTAFFSLHKQKKLIESELNAGLDWQELPQRGASRIIQYNLIDYTNEKNWSLLFDWFKERAEAFHKTFSDRIQNLDIDIDDEDG